MTGTLAANWLNTNAPTGEGPTAQAAMSGTVSNDGVAYSTTGYQVGWSSGSNTIVGGTTYTYPWWYVPVYTGGPNIRPIKLALSEVEHLRTKARKDKRLREILEKFTDQIEITVDFK